MPEWKLADWHEPDLDRGIILHKTLTNAQVKAQITPKSRSMSRLVHAADKFANECDAAGICVLAEEWLIGGCDDT